MTVSIRECPERFLSIPHSQLACDPDFAGPSVDMSRVLFLHIEQAEAAVETTKQPCQGLLQGTVERHELFCLWFEGLGF